MFGFLGNDTLATVLLVIFILQYKRIAGFCNLTKIGLRSSEWSSVARSEVPAHTVQLLDCAAPGLRGLGFEWLSSESAPPLNVCDPRARMYADLYWHPERKTVAQVELAEPMTGQILKISFTSVFETGRELLTVNREQWAQFPAPEGIRVVDAYSDDVGSQWQAHEHALADELEEQVAIAIPEDALRRGKALKFPHWLAHLQALGWVKEDTTDNYQFTAKGAWMHSGQILQHLAKAKAALVRPYHHDPLPNLETTRLAEMDSVASILALALRPLPPWIKLGLFVLTLTLSALFFWGSFGLLDAAALLTVLLVHELGHFAAMWAFDYRNLSIFFLPLLGAAVTGHKPQATVWQEAIVLLAGPVPGLILALAASQIPSESLPLPVIEFLRSWVAFALGLNLFNLLPFGILDGGRLFELAVLGRFPYARAVFALVGVALGLAYAVWSQSMLFGVAILLLLTSLPLQFRAARVIAAIRARFRAEGVRSLAGEAVIQAMGREFAQGEHGGTGLKGYSRRVGIARLAYPRLLQGVPGVGAGLGIFAVQCLALLLPLALIAWHMRQPESAPLSQLTQVEQQEVQKRRDQIPEDPEALAARHEFMARFEAETHPETRWTMLDGYLHEEETEFVIDPAWLEQQKTELLARLPEDHPGRLRHELEDAENDPAKMTDTLLSAIARLTGTRKADDLDAERFKLLVELYDWLVQMPGDGARSQAGAIETLWASLGTPNHPYAGHRAALAATRARIAFAASDNDGAALWMARFVADADPEAEDEPALAQGWFWLDIGRHDQALALATQHLATALSPDVLNARWRTLAGWAEMGLGHPREADNYFQAVLNDRAARWKANQQQVPWWIRGLNWFAAEDASPRRQIDSYTLDHLAALEAYDSPEAQRLATELADLVAGQRKHPFIQSKFDGWGQAREAAHDKWLAVWFPQDRTTSVP